MNFPFIFVTGEVVNIDVEVGTEIRVGIQDADKKDLNKNRAETRRHESLDASSFEGLGLEYPAQNNTEAEALQNIDSLQTIKDPNLFAAVMKLKPKEQHVLRRLYFDKETVTPAELAEEMQTGVEAIWKFDQRLTKKLRHLMQE